MLQGRGLQLQVAPSRSHLACQTRQQILKCQVCGRHKTVKQCNARRSKVSACKALASACA